MYWPLIQYSGLVSDLHNYGGIIEGHMYVDRINWIFILEVV